MIAFIFAFFRQMLKNQSVGIHALDLALTKNSWNLETLTLSPWVVWIANALCHGLCVCNKAEELWGSACVPQLQNFQCNWVMSQQQLCECSGNYWGVWTLKLLLDSISGKPFNISEQLLFLLALASLVHAQINSLSVCNTKIHLMLTKVIHMVL